MTEAQAKMKMCCGPPARYAQSDSFKCQGSACMAFRITDHPDETRQTGIESPGDPPRPEGEGWEPQALFIDGKYSYRGWSRPRPSTAWCGLAGKPE